MILETNLEKSKKRGNDVSPQLYLCPLIITPNYRDFRDSIPFKAGQVENLGIKAPIRKLLPGKEILGGLFPKPLETACEIGDPQPQDTIGKHSISLSK